MARIPQFSASRQLDVASAPQYPSGSPVGAAITGFGNTLQGVAERFKAIQDKKDAFDTTLRENEMGAAISALEQDTLKNAPADGNGIHDAVYGQIDPKTNTAVKPGSFDSLFDSYLERIPESKRAEFAALRETYRLRGSNRMAQAQYGAQQDYYKVEIQKTQQGIIAGIMESDPNDVNTYETFKSNGLDIIEKSGLPALEKDVAKANWEANASEALYKTLLAKDPEFATKAKAALGLASDSMVETPAGAIKGFEARLVTRESGGRADVVNGLGYAGLYQFGAPRLADLGIYNPQGENLSGWSKRAGTTGKWTGEFNIPGHPQVKKLADFLASPSAQRTAFEIHRRKMDSEIAERGLEQYIGQTVGGVQITRDGIHAMMHLGGAGGTAKALRSGGANNAADANGTTLLAYAKMGTGSGGSVDPRFSSIPADRRLVLANEADRLVSERTNLANAQMKAEYAQHKDSIELGIVRGEILNEDLIVNDQSLKDGDKASLIRALRSQNEGANQVAADLSALSGGSLVLDPYASKDKTRADNLYSDLTKRVPPEQHGSIAGAILEQTGVVPQPVINSIRRGLASDNAAEVVTAAQLAQRISSFDPAALGRRDGGGEVQTAADDFTFYVNKMNLTPEEAARRIIDSRSPENKFTRKAMEGAAKEFVKAVEKEDIAAIFDDSWFSDPVIGFNEGQRLGIQAEYVAIAEDQFYAANGDPELAKSRAAEQMKRLYGVTEMTGRKVVMKHPPEKYWPKFPVADAAQSLSYPTQLRDDVKAISPTADLNSIQLVTTPETDAMVKRGEMPGYAVLYKDENGVMQTIPGKLWKPDITKIQQMQQTIDETNKATNLEDARREQGIYRREIQKQEILNKRQKETGDILRGGPMKGAEDAPEGGVKELEKALFGDAAEEGGFRKGMMLDTQKYRGD
jgi:hypothetical protein